MLRKKKYISMLLFCCASIFITGCGTATYKVRYELNGGRVLAGELVQEVKRGRDAEDPVVEREGYLFLGWDKSTREVKSDVDTTARWEKVYIIEFDPNGGEILSGETEQHLVAGETPVEPEAAFDGMIFEGWYPAVTAVSQDEVYLAQWASENGAESQTELSETLDSVFQKESDAEPERDSQEESETESKHLGMETLSCEVGDIITFGIYEQDNNESNGKEDIEWIVLAKDNNAALLLSKYALDCQRYNNYFEYVTWETCSLREWLNDTFLHTAFSSQEAEKIVVATVTADANPEHSSNAGNDTKDKIFLLSAMELEKYFTGNSKRECKATVYAENQLSCSVRDNRNCWWWLRTPGDFGNRAVNVTIKGTVDYTGHSVDNCSNGVRPALWIDLDDSTHETISHISDNSAEHFELADSIGEDIADNDFIINGTTLVSYTGTDSIVEIPDGVTTIGVNAFAKSSTLQGVSIPDSVTTIDTGAFEYCINLEYVSLPASLIELKALAFRGCESLAYIDLPEGLGVIENNAFRECSALKEVTVPSSVWFIDYSAFGACDSLKEIKVREGNTKFISANGILYSSDGQTLVAYPAGINEKHVTVREGVRTIQRSSFIGCTSIEEVTIPESVVFIGSYAFSDCTSLSTIVLPKSVVTIKNHAFTGDTELKKVTITNPVATLDEQIFEINTMICAPKGSTAEEYAKENGNPFEERIVQSTMNSNKEF